MIQIKTIKLSETTAGYCDVVNITPQVQEQIAKAGIQSGSLVLFVSGSTAALTTLEYEPGLIQDLKQFVERLVPSDRPYNHDDRWGDNNGFSHIRACLFGPSLAIPITDGRPLLGTWQQIILIDFDNRPRSREIVLQLMGDARQERAPGKS